MYLLTPYSHTPRKNRPAAERAAKQEPAQVRSEPAQAAAQSSAPLQSIPSPVARTEDPSRYCPVCSQPLESRRCKLICSVCGYYMSCSDYYYPRGVLTATRPSITILRSGVLHILISLQAPPRGAAGSAF